MSDTSFSFVKIAEEELRLSRQWPWMICAVVAGGIARRQDEKDPEWVSLYEEFQRIMKKHMIQEQEGYTLENIKETQKTMKNSLRSGRL